MQFNSFEIVKFPRVYMIDRFRSDSNLIGCIHITSRHVIFKADHVRKELWLMNKLIGSAEKVGSTSYGSKILIRCKNYLSIILIVKENEAVDFLQKLANVSSKTFRTFIENKKIEIQKDIWEGEFRRQKLPTKWAKSWLNEQYEYCETYPRELWFPASVSKATIIGSSKFRIGGRLPVLTYYHHKSDATISRCSQPLSGFSGRCIEDEELVKHILDANSNNTQIYLIDTRPVMNAIINMMQGIGYEDIKNYVNLKRHSFEIEGYSVIRDSLGELLEACNYTNNSHTCYLTMIEKCRWLKHLRAIVECSKFIAESVSSQISCVVLSTDENIQIFSIAQIILDPHYRTIKGFQILIEKDWLGLSHQFEDIAPVFTQFLDVIYQIMKQKPTKIEFNQRFLIELNDYLLSGQYKILLGNSEKDKQDLNLNVNGAQSLWVHFNEQVGDYLNPFYINDENVISEISIHPSSFSVWTDLYNRFDTGILARDSVEDVILNFKEQMEAQKHGATPVIYQSMSNVDECSGEHCKLEFNTKIERRYHCNYCGLIYCKRCIRLHDSIRACTVCQQNNKTIIKLTNDVSKLNCISKS